MRISSLKKPRTLKSENPVQAQDGAEHQHDEQDRRGVDTEHEVGEGPDGAEPVLTDGEGDAGTRTNGGQAHHHGDDAEQRVEQAVDDDDHRLAAFARLNQGEAEEQRDQDDLQHGALGEGIHHRRGDDVHEEADDAGLRFRPLGVGGDSAAVDMRGVDVHADARLHHVDHHEADDEGQRRDDLEVDQRAHTDAADLLHVTHLGDADHDGTEDDRREQHLDQLDEAVRQGLQRDGDVGQEIPDEPADDDCYEDLNIESA